MQMPWKPAVQHPYLEQGVLKGTAIEDPENRKDPSDDILEPRLIEHEGTPKAEFEFALVSLYIAHLKRPQSG